jgi:hypothetical protein
MQKGETRMLDKDKMIEYLKNEIESCKVARTASDIAIMWECERILERIELGWFDSVND